MLKTLANVFRVPELRNKVLFTLGLLCVYRIGFYVPLPGVDAPELVRQAKAAAEGNSVLGVISNYLSLFSGGDLGQSTIFGLGIMPYISASIILQLLSTVLPNLEKLRKEGEPGMRKINEWTRYLTVAVCLVQAFLWMMHLTTAYSGTLIYPGVRNDPQLMALFWLTGIVVLTAGSVFLMWLGEQIDQYGIGNGVSLIITAGIVSRMPAAIGTLYNDSPFKGFFESLFTGQFIEAFGGIGQNIQDPNIKYGLPTLGFVLFTFVFVVAGSILLTQAQRRIKIQQAKHMRGRRVYGGQASYLPLRVNHAGVMPVIFASSLMVFPSMLAGTVVNWLSAGTGEMGAVRGIMISIVNSFHPGMYLYELLYIGMIFFFSYFWNTVQFQPKEIANQLRDYGSFIPGLRPGKRTADYLEAVMTRTTYVGAAFLCVIAVIPTLVAQFLLGGGSQAYLISQFLGGTGLLIVIQVMLDLVNRVEANLIMRNYGGFLDEGKDKGGEGGGGGRVRRSGGGPVRGGPQPQPASRFNSGSPKGLPT